MVYKKIKRFTKKLYTISYVFVVEALAILVCSALYLFRTSKLDLSKKNPNSKSTILCVHGYLHNETPWGFFRRYLQHHGAGPVHTVSYSTIFKDIPENSLRIKERIEQIKRETGKDVNVLIGHSLGGLESIEYALEHAPKDKVIHIVTLASPLHGSKLSILGFGPCPRQMSIGSSYLKSMHKRLKEAKHIKLLNLVSESDPLVIPPKSALLHEYAFAKGEVIEALGHVSMLFSKRTLDKIIKYLRHHDKI